MGHGHDMFGGGGPRGGFGPGDGTGPIHDVLASSAGPWEWLMPLLLVGLLVAILVFAVLSWRTQRMLLATSGAPGVLPPPGTASETDDPEPDDPTEGLESDG